MKELRSYNVGVYCRLSRDDGDSGNSSSIKTQKEMIVKYVKENGWKVFDIYVDDGYSGTNYDRPGFQRLIRDIEAGNVNMVAVKDLSRLGRNYILTGQYTDIYFPDRGVRFVALNDGIDSLNSNNDIAAFRNILNQMYAADISKKVSSAVRAKKQKGEFVSAFAPIGYQKDPANINRLVVEEKGAAIVRRIFEMARLDMGSKKICHTLNGEGILTPANHRRLLNGMLPKPARWSTETVISILRNRMYVGDMIQGIYECSQFRRTPPKRKPESEWFITPGTHEPLVDRETWELVQKMIDARNRPVKNKVIQLFAGFVKCEDCGHAMAYAYSQNIEQYTCGQYRHNGKNFCSCHYIRKDVLEQVVLDDIRKYSKLAKNQTDVLIHQLRQQSGDKDAILINSLTTELEKTSDRNGELDRILKRLYEDSVNGKISDEMFSKFMMDYEKEQSEVQQKISTIEQEIKETKANQKDSDSWVKLIRDYTNIKKLDRAVLGELVDKITVGEAKEVDGHKVTNVTIYYRFVGAVS